MLGEGAGQNRVMERPFPQLPEPLNKVLPVTIHSLGNAAHQARVGCRLPERSPPLPGGLRSVSLQGCGFLSLSLGRLWGGRLGMRAGGFHSGLSQ